MAEKMKKKNNKKNRANKENAETKQRRNAIANDSTSIKKALEQSSIKMKNEEHKQCGLRNFTSDDGKR